MAHHEKLPAPNLLTRGHNKIYVNGNGNNKDPIISFSNLLQTGWYVDGPDLIYTSNGTDRIIYGADHI